MEKFRQLLARKGLTGKDYELLKTHFGNEKDARDAVKTKNSWQLEDLIYQIEKDIRQAQMDDILWREEQDAENPLIIEFKNDFLMNRAIAQAGGGYIQNQSILEDYPYGTKGTGAGNSCGAISDYNLQVSLGLEPDFKQIYNYHSDNSTLFNGNFGTNPLKLYSTISDNPQVEKVVVYDHPKLVEEHDAYIVISGNATNPGSKWMHYQEAHINGNGEIEFSNPTEQDKNGNNYTSFEDFNNDLIDNNDLVFLIYGVDKKH